MEHKRVQALRRWDRVWSLPVWAHLLALTAILLLLVPVVGTSQSFLADEGAALIQARSLEAGDGWIVEHPLPEVDPDGAWYPIINAERGERGAAPLGKHPAYPILAAAAARLAGVTGIVLLSLAGTVAAAGLAAALAGRFDRALIRPALWVVGLASPMLFDGYLAMAHTLGAALATAALLAAVVAVQDRRPAVALLVAPPVAAAVLLRNEALLFAVALTLVAAALSLRRANRMPAAVVAGVALMAMIGARLLERVWIAEIIGGAVGVSVGVPASGEGLVRGRVDGFLMTWLTPGYDRSPLLGLALLVMLVAVVICAFNARSRPDQPAGVVGPAVIAAVAALVALVTAPSNTIPGLLIACPLVPAGLIVMRRGALRNPGAALVGATAALFAGAVIATQYSVGGSGEWGGRYFALLVPASIPLLLSSLCLQGRSLQPAARRRTAAALVVCSAALSVMAISGLRANHQAKARLVERIEAAGLATGDSRPVIVTTWIAGARSMWPTFEDHRWLHVPPADLPLVRARLKAVGVERFVFVTTDLAHDVAHLGDVERSLPEGAVRPGRQVLVLRSG